MSKRIQKAIIGRSRTLGVGRMQVEGAAAEAAVRRQAAQSIPCSWPGLEGIRHGLGHKLVEVQGRARSLVPMTRYSARCWQSGSRGG